MQDINLGLRETLKNYMNMPEHTGELRARWLTSRRESDMANAIQTDESDLARDWQEIVNMRHANNNVSAAPAVAAAAAASHLSGASSSSPLVYLEDIHIFALANLLRRTIVVISLPTLKNIQAIHLRGIYLPLLVDTRDCVRDPICITFHDFHFMPLLLALDDRTAVATSSSSSSSSSSMSLDEQVARFDTLANNYQSTASLSSLIGATTDDTSSSTTTSTTSDSDYEQLVSSVMSRRRRRSNNARSSHARPLDNLLPLAYANGERMKLHFLSDDEQRQQQQQQRRSEAGSSKYEAMLGAYMNVVSVELGAADFDPDVVHLRAGERRVLIAAYMFKQTVRIKNDGIDAYLTYLNEATAILTNTTSTTTTTPPTTTTKYEQAQTTRVANLAVAASSSSSPLGNQTNNYHSVFNNTTSPSQYDVLCKTASCTNQQLADRAKFYGYCYSCFKQLYCPPPPNQQSFAYSSIDTSTASSSSSRVLGPRRVAQQVQHHKEPQLIDLHVDASPPPAPAPQPQPRQQQQQQQQPYASPRTATIITTSSGRQQPSDFVVIANENRQPSLLVCANESCRNIVQPSMLVNNRGQQVLCNDCYASSAQQQLNKQQQPTKFSREAATEQPVQLPIRYVMKTNDGGVLTMSVPKQQQLQQQTTASISAYDHKSSNPATTLAHSSKLYNPDKLAAYSVSNTAYTSNNSISSSSSSSNNNSRQLLTDRPSLSSSSTRYYEPMSPVRSPGSVPAYANFVGDLNRQQRCHGCKLPFVDNASRFAPSTGAARWASSGYCERCWPGNGTFI